MIRIGTHLNLATEPRAPGMTSLEAYLRQVVAMPVRTISDARMQAAAKRLSKLIGWHEIEVLTDPTHTPGAPRGGQLWADLRRLSAPTSKPSERMVARGVMAHLADHERSLIAGHSGFDPDIA